MNISEGNLNMKIGEINMNKPILINEKKPITPDIQIGLPGCKQIQPVRSSSYYKELFQL